MIASDPRLPVMEISGSRDGTFPRFAGMRTAQALPRHTRPRPGRRRRTRYQLPFHLGHSLILAIIVSLSFCGTVHAADAGTRAIRSQQRMAGFVGVVEEEIIFDRRPSPQPALYRRAEASTILPPMKSFTGTASAIAPSATSSDSASTSIESAPTKSDVPLPKPFDGGLGTNYTQPSCPTFLKSMITNDTFTSCMPFSLLLQVSQDRSGF